MPATWWAQLRRGPTFMYLALLTCWSVTVFFAFSSKSRNPARALGGPLLGAPAPWRRHVVRFPRHFAGLGVRCPPPVLRDQRLGSFCACQRPPSIANQRRSAPLIAVIFFFTGPALINLQSFFGNLVGINQITCSWLQWRQFLVKLRLVKHVPINYFAWKSVKLGQ